MRIEAWNRDLSDDQQNVIGRFRYLGAPLTGWADHDTPDFAIKGAAGDRCHPPNGTP
jgi:deferrochelatase/peroxidase EfeB